MEKIPILFIFLVARTAWAQYAHSGYEYRAPQVNTQQQQAYFGAQEPLNRFLPSPGYPRANDGYQTQQRPIQQQSQYQGYNYQGYQTAQAQTGFQNVNFNGYNQNYAANSLGAQNTQQTAQTNFASNAGYANSEAQRPVITKHIYFHLPPPDDAPAAPPVTAAPPKKIYNILFIKLPSQNTANAARLQQLINRQAAIDKTLIYVLVKKPESQLVQPVTSKPEVFFVKYKEPRSVALQVGGGAGAEPRPAGAPGLLPGLVNGHGN